MWKGATFHSLVAEYLRKVYQRIELLPIDLFDTYEQKMRNQWEFSTNYVSSPNSKVFDQGNGIVLSEHFYQKNPSESFLADAIKDVENWAKRFSTWVENTVLYRDIHQVSQIWIEPQIYGTEAPGFELDGIQIITKVDLAFLTPEGQFNIFD